MTFLDHRGQPVRTLDSLRGHPRLAVFYPGRGYGPMAPLFYYLAEGLEAAGWDVLSLDYRYNENPEFLLASPEDQVRWINADALTLGEQLRSFSGPYSRVARVAKSLGAALLLTQLRAGQIGAGDDLVWLTPASAVEAIYGSLPTLAQRSLVAYGTGDKFYDKARADAAADWPRVTVVGLAGAGHTFDEPGDVQGSMANLAFVVGAVLDFLGEEG
jgi:acetyl esterase/lipase